MAETRQPSQPESVSTRFSYLFMVGLLLLIIVLRLASPLVAALFTYFALSRLTWRKFGGQWLALVLFLVFFFGIAYASGYFIHQTMHALPEIADKAIPSVIDTAQRNGI